MQFPDDSLKGQIRAVSMGRRPYGGDRAAGQFGPDPDGFSVNIFPQIPRGVSDLLRRGIVVRRVLIPVLLPFDPFDPDGGLHLLFS